MHNVHAPTGCPGLGTLRRDAVWSKALGLEQTAPDAATVSFHKRSLVHVAAAPDRLQAAGTALVEAAGDKRNLLDVIQRSSDKSKMKSGASCEGGTIGANWGFRPKQGMQYTSE